MVSSTGVTTAEPTPTEGTKKRILVIEDEPDIVRGLRDALEFEGFEVQARGTGAEGLTAAMDWAPDCVLLDLMLPDDNGYRVCETLRPAPGSCRLRRQGRRRRHRPVANRVSARRDRALRRRIRARRLAGCTLGHAGSAGPADRTERLAAGWP
jgi:CheY-like chemotaxis protein